MKPRIITLVAVCTLACPWFAPAAPRGPIMAAASPISSTATLEPSAVPTATNTTSPVKVTLARLPRGSPLTTEYLSNNRVVLPDGNAVALQPHPVRGIGMVTRFGRFGDRWGTFHNLADGWMTAWYELDGELAEIVANAEGLVATSPNGRYALLGWLKGLAVVTLSGERTVWPLSLSAEGQAIGFLGPRSIVFRARTRTFIGHLDGSSREIPGVFYPTATSPALHFVTGQMAIGMGRDTVFDRRGVPLMRVPGYDLVSFSPAGRWVIGLRSSTRSQHVAVVSMSSNSVKHHLVLRQPINGLCWEDDRHFVATVNETDAVIRVGVDGTVQRVPVMDFPILPRTGCTAPTQPVVTQ